MKRKFASALLALSLILSLAACGTPSGSSTSASTNSTPAASGETSSSTTSGETIKIGTIQDTTGKGSVVGNAILQGHQLAVEDINARGGINGKKLELIVYDCKSDPNEAINAFKRLAEVDKVSAVLGPNISNVGLAVAPYSTELKMPFLGQFGDPRCMLGENLDTLNPYMFLMQPSAAQAGIISGLYMMEKLGLSKPAFLVAQDHSYNSYMANTFIDYCKANNIEIATVQYNKQSDIDFKTQLTNIKNSGADFIFNANPSQSLVISTSQIYQLGIDLPQTGGLEFAIPFNELVSDPDMARNIYVATNLDMSADSVSSVFNTYAERFGETPGPKSFLGYDQVVLAAHAIEQAGTDPVAVRDALENLKDVPTLITPTFNMNPETHMPDGLGMFMYKLDKGEYTGLEMYFPAAAQ
ncbi:ABC transporter substrate-binding protein [Oscillospiraceae bacterium MB08-C2-2]|nr:ABC transporter substrate-binding protein [Oscillospiraceae bacterium MB08-C2-2]